MAEVLNADIQYLKQTRQDSATTEEEGLFSNIGQKLIGIAKDAFWIELIVLEVYAFVKSGLWDLLLLTFEGYGDFVDGGTIILSFIVFLFVGILIFLACWFETALVIGFAEIIRNLEKGGGRFVVKAEGVSAPSKPAEPSMVTVTPGLAPLPNTQSTASTSASGSNARIDAGLPAL